MRNEDKKYNKRGVWEIETDLTQLAGKSLYITYTYRIKNIGDPDYTTSALRNDTRTYGAIAAAIRENNDNE